MRLLICDDDSHVRVVLRAVLEERGHEVVGEAGSAIDAIALLRSLKPEAAVVDLALQSGSGNDVITYALGHQCRVVVFSAFLSGSDTLSRVDAAVAKPDFAALEAAVDALASKTRGDHWRANRVERRALLTARPAPASPLEDPADFYRALGEAVIGDTVMFIALVDASPLAIEALATVVRGVIRTQDHLMRRDNQLVLLLVDGQADAGEAVAARLRTAWKATAQDATWTSRHAVSTPDESPSDVFQRLRNP